jgi:glutathione synthase/RimK-type ligase-like ATP-grasp enzyme
MHRMCEKHIKRKGNLSAELSRCMPETYVLDLLEMEEEEEDLEEEMERIAVEAGVGNWVLKASESNRGQDVHLFSRDRVGCKDMLELVKNSSHTMWLLQKHVEPPLLHMGRKFHIRAMALVVGDVSVYVHDYAIVIPAHSAYSENVDGSVDRMAFITNHCVQSAHNEYEAGRFLLLR